MAITHESKPAGIWSWGWLLIAAASLSGCGITQKQRLTVERFSTATIQTADLVSREFARVRGDVIELRRGMLALKASSVDLDDPALDLDGPLDLDDAGARLRAAAALKHFGELLRALVTAQAEPIRRSGERFAAGLREIEGVGLSDRQVRSLGDLFSWAGRALTDEMKRKALREVVMQTRGPLQALAEDLSQSFDPDAGLWAAGLAQTVSHIEDTLGKRVSLNAGVADEPARRTQYRRLRADAAERWMAFEEARGQVVAVLEEFQRAHDALFYAVQGEGIDAPRVEVFFQRAQELVRLYRLIRE